MRLAYRLDLRRILIFHLLIALTSATLADRLNTDSYYCAVGRSCQAKSYLASFRDKVVATIWRVPDPASRTECLYGVDPPTVRESQATRPRAQHGDLVLRFLVTSEDEVLAVSAASSILLLDVWQSNRKWVDIRLAKEQVSALLSMLPPCLQHAHTPLIRDLAQAILESTPISAHNDLSHGLQSQQRAFGPDLTRQNSATNIFFQEYQPLSVLVPWMRLLRSLFPTHVRLVNIGLTYEAREILALRVGVHPNNAEQPAVLRQTIIVMGGSHAREWISTSTVSYLAYAFITGYGKDKAITALLEKFDILFIPTINPDGYAYTWSNDRLWRKNRQNTAFRFCDGIDLDRSFDFHWNNDTDSGNPCSESHAGNHPFEAIESLRLANWVRNESHNNVQFVGFLDFHSYSQQVLYPYSFSCASTPPLSEKLEELALGLVKAIRTTSGEVYGVASACESTSMNFHDRSKRYNSEHEPKTSWSRSQASGGSALDWFHHEMKIPYAYQIKLRDTGSYGFLLPSENILPTGKEALQLLSHFVTFLASNADI